jgi:hypothetical protein
MIHDDSIVYDIAARYDQNHLNKHMIQHAVGHVSDLLHILVIFRFGRTAEVSGCETGIEQRRRFRRRKAFSLTHLTGSANSRYEREWMRRISPAIPPVKDFPAVPGFYFHPNYSVMGGRFSPNVGRSF